MLVDSNNTQLEGATKRVDVWEHNPHIEDDTCGTQLRTFQEEIAHRYWKAHPGTDETFLDSQAAGPYLKKAQPPRDEADPNPSPKVKPDSEPAAPKAKAKAKAKPKPKTDRKPATPYAKAKSKVPDTLRTPTYDVAT
eukprot:jgi/Tetstr1/430392/TSEL_020202.t1